MRLPPFRPAGRFLVVAVLGVACRGDDSLSPNTDIGLRIWAVVSPQRISVGDSTGTFRVQLNVHNPSDQAIRVASGGPPNVALLDPGQSRGLFGSVRIACGGKPLDCGPRLDWAGESAFVIPAHTTMYEEAPINLRNWARGGWPLVPGHYRVRVWFNGREGTSAPLVLEP